MLRKSRDINLLPFFSTPSTKTTKITDPESPPPEARNSRLSTVEDAPETPKSCYVDEAYITQQLTKKPYHFGNPANPNP